jgi:endonuclease/exonuclease/phosphatase family metal-dependent hydrolase
MISQGTHGDLSGARGDLSGNPKGISWESYGDLARASRAHPAFTRATDPQLMKPIAMTILLLAIGITAQAETLRVMTFNVRYPAKDDGPNVWENRRDILVRAILEKDPDVMGTQELFHLQGEYIVEQAPAYAWFGISRRGNDQDEHMGVFYKKEKLRAVESGNFWLSETPEVPGSVSWDMSLPRMVTWALFERLDTRTRFYFYNTHFAHRPQDDAARLESARLIAERLRALPGDVPLILSGDFNAPAEEQVYETLLEAQLEDAWKNARKRSGPETTLSRWRGNREGRRIDWILYRGGPQPLEAEIITYNEENRYPSDHYPVLAVFDF